MEQFTSRDPATNAPLHHLYLDPADLRGIWGAPVGSELHLASGRVLHVMQSPTLIQAMSNTSHLSLMLGHRNATGTMDGQLCITPTGIESITGRAVGSDVTYYSGKVFHVMEAPGAIAGLIDPLQPVNTND